MTVDFVEFRHLERLANKSPSKFLNFLKEALFQHGLEYCVRLLKLSGICVDIYGTGNNRKTYEKCLNVLVGTNREKDERISKLDKEVCLWNSIFEDFRNLRHSTGVEEIKLKRQIPSFLLVIEMVISAGMEYALGHKLKDIKQRYPLVLALGDEEEKIIEDRRAHSHLLQIMDNIMENAGIILRYLIYNKAPLEGNKTTVSGKDLRTSLQHIFLIDRYDQLLHQYEFWKFYDSELEMSTNFNIFIKPIDLENYVAQHVSNTRYRMLRMKWMFDFGVMASQMKVDPETKSLPPKNLRIDLEGLASIFCHEFFGSEELAECLLGVPLAEWIRAFTVLHQEGKKYIDSRTSVAPLALSKWCIVQSKEVWVETMKKGGIEESKAEIIIDNLTFGPDSKDMLDCPLFPIDGLLLALPSILYQIEPGAALMSNFLSKSLDVSFKGRGLEKRLLTSISDAGLKCSEVSDNDNGEEFQCDIVFKVEDDLFYVECKSFIQPSTPREHYELFDKLYEATKQLNRIADYYNNKLDKVKHQLKLRDDWVPKNSHRLVVCSAMVGQETVINGCHIIDESAFRRFFDRESPGFVIGKVAVPFPDENYEGETTTEKLINVLNCLPQVLFAKKQLVAQAREMTLDAITIQYIGFTKLMGDYFNLNDEEINKLAKELGIKPEILKGRPSLK